MKVLGISAFNHDSAAALVIDEIFSKRKFKKIWYFFFIFSLNNFTNSLPKFNIL